MSPMQEIDFERLAAELESSIDAGEEYCFEVVVHERTRFRVMIGPPIGDALPIQSWSQGAVPPPEEDVAEVSSLLTMLVGEYTRCDLYNQAETSKSFRQLAGGGIG